MADLPLFPFTTQEDWYGELAFLSADSSQEAISLEGRTFEMPITLAAQGSSLIEPVKTLTMQAGGGLSLKAGAPNTLVFRVPRDVARGFARSEYTADVLEVVSGERHLFMPVRIRYSEPSGILSFISRFVGVSVSFSARLQPIVSPVAITGRQGVPGATILNGLVPPVPADGKNGDFWIEDRTASNRGRRMYGPKANGAWPGNPWTIQVSNYSDVPGLLEQLSNRALLITKVSVRNCGHWGRQLSTAAEMLAENNATFAEAMRRVVSYGGGTITMDGSTRGNILLSAFAVEAIYNANAQITIDGGDWGTCIQPGEACDVFIKMKASGIVLKEFRIADPLNKISKKFIEATDIGVKDAYGNPAVVADLLIHRLKIEANDGISTAIAVDCNGAQGLVVSDLNVHGTDKGYKITSRGVDNKLIGLFTLGTRVGIELNATIINGDTPVQPEGFVAMMCRVNCTQPGGIGVWDRAGLAHRFIDVGNANNGFRLSLEDAQRFVERDGTQANPDLSRGGGWIFDGTQPYRGLSTIDVTGCYAEGVPFRECVKVLGNTNRIRLDGLALGGGGFEDFPPEQGGGPVPGIYLEETYLSVVDGCINQSIIGVRLKMVGCTNTTVTETNNFGDNEGGALPANIEISTAGANNVIALSDFNGATPPAARSKGTAYPNASPSPYTPTFGTTDGKTPTVTVVKANYTRKGQWVKVAGRLKVTDYKGATGALLVSMPFNTMGTDSISASAGYFLNGNRIAIASIYAGNMLISTLDLGQIPVGANEIYFFVEYQI